MSENDFNLFEDDTASDFSQDDSPSLSKKGNVASKKLMGKKVPPRSAVSEETIDSFIEETKKVQPREVTEEATEEPRQVPPRKVPPRQGTPRQESVRQEAPRQEFNSQEAPKRRVPPVNTDQVERTFNETKEQVVDLWGSLKAICKNPLNGMNAYLDQADMKSGIVLWAIYCVLSFITSFVSTLFIYKDFDYIGHCFKSAGMVFLGNIIDCGVIVLLIFMLTKLMANEELSIGRIVAMGSLSYFFYIPVKLIYFVFGFFDVEFMTSISSLFGSFLNTMASATWVLSWWFSLKNKNKVIICLSVYAVCSTLAGILLAELGLGYSSSSYVTELLNSLF